MTVEEAEVPQPVVVFEFVGIGFEQTCIGGKLAAGPPAELKESVFVSIRDDS